METIVIGIVQKREINNGLIFFPYEGHVGSSELTD
jgi:hypothetical protein